MTMTTLTIGTLSFEFMNTNTGVEHSLKSALGFCHTDGDRNLLFALRSGETATFSDGYQLTRIS